MARVLLAEDDDAVRDMLRTSLERDGFEVVAVANVCEALSRIATESFDVLLSDLHMPLAGDGFTVVSAMRHTHPRAVTLVLSGYPELDEALSAIRLQADEVLVKPIEIASLREIIRDKLSSVDFSQVLLDVMTIADEVDSQLKQAMLSFVEPDPGATRSLAA